MYSRTFHALRAGLLGAVMLACTSIAGAAEAPGGDEAIRALVKSINPKAVIHQISDTPMPGIKAVTADSNVLYVTSDAKYMMYGVMLDVADQRNLTEDYLAPARISTLIKVPETAKIIFSPQNPKYSVLVFTDVSCGYCQQFHKNIQTYLDAGIRVEYVPWPRGGADSPALAEMKSVWCAKDRKSAFTAAIAGQQVPKTDCAASKQILDVYALGEKLNIEGTPAVFGGTGRKLGGYLPADRLIAKLQQEQLDNGSVPLIVQAARAP